MKVLSIGNSFSQDAHKWLHQIAALNHFEMETANLYIGGCSLERHWNNWKADNADYDLECNGESSGRKISISEALKMQDWDVITLQQVSHDSGLFQTYIPFITDLADRIRESQPQAHIYFHQTWAYEIDSTHEGFAAYRCDQQEMYRQIKDASERAAKLIASEIIPTGTVIQKLRDSVEEFDYKNGGISLCRDGFHLSFDYGRFAAAATWYHTLTGQTIAIRKFADFDAVLLRKILAVILDS